MHTFLFGLPHAVLMLHALKKKSVTAYVTIIKHENKVFLQTSECEVIFLKRSNQIALTFSGIIIYDVLLFPRGYPRDYLRMSKTSICNIGIYTIFHR